MGLALDMLMAMRLYGYPRSYCSLCTVYEMELQQLMMSPLKQLALYRLIQVYLKLEIQSSSVNFSIDINNCLTTPQP